MRIETDYPKSDGYSVQYQCDNCGWGGNWRFKNGKRAPAIVVCTKCGCMTAKKMITMPYVPKIAPKTKDSSLPFIRPTWDQVLAEAMAMETGDNM